VVGALFQAEDGDRRGVCPLPPTRRGGGHRFAVRWGTPPVWSGWLLKFSDVVLREMKELSMQAGGYPLLGLSEGW